MQNVTPLIRDMSLLTLPFSSGIATIASAFFLSHQRPLQTRKRLRHAVELGMLNCIALTCCDERSNAHINPDNAPCFRSSARSHVPRKLHEPIVPFMG